MRRAHHLLLSASALAFAHPASAQTTPPATPARDFGHGGGLHPRSG